MSIEQLGSLGELLAAIATIITLIYLALQIRQSNKLLLHEQLRGVQDDADRWPSYLITDKEMAKVYRIGLKQPDGFDADDQLPFPMMQDQLFFGWQHTFFNELSSNPTEYFIANTLNQPGARLTGVKENHYSILPLSRLWKDVVPRRAVSDNKYRLCAHSEPDAKIAARFPRRSAKH